MVFPSITPSARLLCSRFGAGQFRAGDPVEILENKEQTPRLEGAPVPLPAAHFAPEGKALEAVHTSFELCTEKAHFCDAHHILK